MSDAQLFWVCVNEGGSVFCKTDSYFREQKGHEKAWGKKWECVRAMNIEHAREIACDLFPTARPYKQQAAFDGEVPSKSLTAEQRAVCGLVPDARTKEG